MLSVPMRACEFHTNCGECITAPISLGCRWCGDMCSTQCGVYDTPDTMSCYPYITKVTLLFTLWKEVVAQNNLWEHLHIQMRNRLIMCTKFNHINTKIIFISIKWFYLHKIHCCNLLHKSQSCMTELSFGLKTNHQN